MRRYHQLVNLKNDEVPFPSARKRWLEGKEEESGRKES
jgi:hypothetical protein